MKLSIGEKDVNINLNLPGGGLTTLTIVFVVLKALGHLDWAWLWVFSPLWIGASLVGLVLLVILIIVLVASRD